MRPVQPDHTMGLYDLYMFGFFLLFILGNAGYIFWRFMTPKLVCDPIHTTTIGRGDKFGIYTCFTMNDIDWGFKVRGKGTIIVPTTAVRHLGNNISLETPVKNIEPNNIPYTIKREVLDRGFKPPYYRGYVSDIQLRKLPMISKLIEEVDNANFMANMMKEELLKRLGTFEKVEEFITRMSRLKKEGAVEKILKWSKGGEEK